MKPNPYPGPNEFTEQQRKLFFGRKREERDIVALISAQPSALIYGKSGTGKSSLINASIIPALREQEFDVLPKTRVQGEKPDNSAAIKNIFMFHVFMNGAFNLSNSDARTLTLAEVLKQRPSENDSSGQPKIRVLIIDQFEELFTAYKENWEQREDFFIQVREALKDNELLRVVFVIREDYIAELDAYAKVLPGLVRSRFRVDLLREDQARDAIVGPPERINSPRQFSDSAAQRLVDNLLVIKETSQTNAQPVKAEFVEPVILQVVCNRLWEALPDGTEPISPTEISQYAKIEDALLKYYEDSLRRLVTDPRLHADEKALRDWFDTELITSDSKRNIVYSGADTTSGLPNLQVAALLDLHIIRGEARAGRFLYEITHEAFVEPILKSNQQWRLTREVQRADRADELRRRLRRNFFRYLAAALFLGLVIAIILAILALNQRDLAERNAEVARTQQALAEQSATEVATLADALQAAFTAQHIFEEGERALAVSLALKVAEIENPPIEADRLLAGIAYAPGARARLDAGSPVHSVAFSPNGSSLAAGLENNDVVLWDVASGGKTLTLTGHTGTVYAVAFGPDGQRILSGSEDGTAITWDVQSGGSTLTFDAGAAIYAVAYSPDRQTVLTGTDDGLVTMWDAETGEKIRTYSGHSGRVRAVAYSLDGQRLLSGSDDDYVIMWDATSGAILSRFKHQGPVYAVAFNRDGTQVLSGSDDTDMNLWDATSGALLHRFTAGTTVWSVAFNRDGTIGAAGTLGQAVIVWNLQSGDEIVRFKDHSDQVKSVAFSPVSDLLASGSGDNSVFLWDITSGAIVAESSQPGYGEMKAQFLPGSTSQAVFYGCKTLAGPESETCLEPGQGVYAVWDLGSQHPIPLEAAAPEDVAYLVATSINGHVAASSDQIGSLFTWDVQTGKVIMRFPLMNGIAFAAALAPDGKRMVSGGCTNSALCLLGDLILWDTTTGEPVRHFAHEDTSQNPTVTSVAFTPDGGGIVSGDFTGAITLWDSNTGGVIWRADDATALTTAIAVTPDQRTVISGHLDGSILQWDMATGELIRRFSGHTETIESLALNLDGSRLASGSDDATVIVWDIATGTILRRFDAQGAQVYGVSFSPDGAQLLSTASDGTCILWRIDTLQELIQWTRANRYIPPES